GTLDKTNTGYDTFNASNVSLSGATAINVSNNGASNQLFIGGSGTGLTGTGTLTINNAGSTTTGVSFRTGVNATHFNGAMIVNGGVVNIGSGASLTLDNTDMTLNSTAILNLGAAFAQAASDASVKSLSGSGTVTLVAQTLTLGSNNGGATFSGVITGSGGVIKTGSGTQVLSGTGSFTGTTTINA